MRLLLLPFFLMVSLVAQGQEDLQTIDYTDDPKELEVGGLRITGASNTDANALLAVSGLRVGGKINLPGDDISRALKALWKLKLFTDVQIIEEKRIGDVIFLEIVVAERPRFARHTFRGVKKSAHDDLNEIVNKYLVKGTIITENNRVTCQNALRDYYVEKGFLDAQVRVIEEADEQLMNAVKLIFDIDKGPRIKIEAITFAGNDNVKAKKLRKQMKETKHRWKIFTKSKLIAADYKDDKEKVIAYYNTLGYRDARILRDSVWRDHKGRVRIHMDVHEGPVYYFRNIAWRGNYIYDDATLSRVLQIKKGDVFNTELLESRLTFSMDGADVSSLYMDDGYLFFQADPVETSIDGDSIDLEIRLYEGPQATIDRVVINGNDRTHEHVIRRELRTVPGAKFSRSDIIRSQRQIINLGYFNQENMPINTPINPQRGTVDIEYTLEEKPSDQLELSAGWGGVNQGVIGTLGVSFNNFSMRNIFHPEAWHPLPQGDGQRLSIRAQRGSRFFQSYNASFTEPWLGGKKPRNFTVAAFFNSVSNGLSRNAESYSGLDIFNLTASLGNRLRWPDDNFILTTALNFQTLNLQNYSRFFLDDGSTITKGKFNNFYLKLSLARNTIVDPTFPRSGSLVQLSAQLSPPYSWFQPLTNFALQDAEAKFKYLEYHKIRLTTEWYTPLIEKLTLRAAAKFGFLGYYNPDKGTIPFERFEVGGAGLANQGAFFIGNELISMRGYDVGDLPANNRGYASVFNKFTLEVRYPISLNPSSTIFVLGFVEGGNAWRTFREYSPFDLRRSAGAGLRVFLPMFGLLGFDYGFGFDKNLPTGSKWSEYGQFNFIIGFEPD
ncbi:MAG: outer membrane protein assembly factor BamA [Lewinellaceae bacterium]|nr:outer membrane protein assembly factor BamA [Lewinellaceae bacterium]HRW75544.1 outer membrane protein assembly factor BamA [Saprospiraceae bacterium]